MIDTLMPLIKQFLPYAQQTMGFKRPPKLFLRSDAKNASNPLGKTAYYDPEGKSVTLYVSDRHPKDIMRSLSHELVHHTQNCRGEFENAGEMGEGYAQNDVHLRNMEREAYEMGNLCFRDWEDSIKQTIYFEHLHKGVKKVMSIKEWKNKEISKNLSEAWGFNFDLDRLDEKTGDDETREKAEKSVKGKGTSKREKDDLEQVDEIAGVTVDSPRAGSKTKKGGHCQDADGNAVGCGSSKCEDGPCKSLEESEIQEGGDRKDDEGAGKHKGEKDYSHGGDRKGDKDAKGEKDYESTKKGDKTKSGAKAYNKYPNKGDEKKGGGKAYSSSLHGKVAGINEDFKSPKSASGAGPSNKGGKMDRSDVANKDTSKFGQGSKSGSHKSASGTASHPKSGKMDRSDVANKATGRWLKEECPPEDEMMGGEVVVMGGEGEEAPESRAMSLVDELRNLIMQLSGEEEVEMAERTKRDSPDRVAGRDAGGRRLKSLEETGLSEAQLRTLVKHALTRARDQRKLTEDSGEEEAWHDWKNEHADDDHIREIEHHLRALKDDRDHERHGAEYDDDKYEDEGYDRHDEQLKLRRRVQETKIRNAVRQAIKQSLSKK